MLQKNELPSSSGILEHRLHLSSAGRGRTPLAGKEKALTRLVTKSCSALFLTALLAAALGCNHDSPTAPEPPGQLTIRLTDAPTDEVSRIDVYITGLKIKPADGPVVRISNEIGPVELLSLRATTRDLVSIGVAPGPYEFVEVELDQSRSSVVERATGATRPLQIASEKVQVQGGFVVPEIGDEVLTLDFDAGASLRHLGNGDWLLTPVIVMLGEGGS